jgi:hypothetical protein
VLIPGLQQSRSILLNIRPDHVELASSKIEFAAKATGDSQNLHTIRSRRTWLEKKHPQVSQNFAFPVASGWIAGGSLMGVALLLWENGPELVRRLVRR